VAYEIIDSHVHYWEPDRPDRPWHKGGVDLGPALSVERLLDDAREAGVEKILQVTPSIMGWDNRYAIEGSLLHSEHVIGVIGRFDPTAPEMPKRLAEIASHAKILGVRITLMKEWTSWLRDGVLEPFLAEAGKIGMRVQIYGPNQPREIHEAARRHPQTIFLVDHMALDHHNPEPFEQWDKVLAMAEAPNVFIKASYFPEVSKQRYPFADVVPYLRSLHESFGADRIIWGSNYPPSSRVCSYKENVDFMREQSFLGNDELTKIFGATLLRALGL
jgi:L-fuconolactonase